MKILGTCLALSLLGLLPISAQDGFDPLGELAEQELPKVIRVQVEFIEVPQETMTELLHGPKTSANDTELRATLQELLKTEKAKMLETQLAIAKSGQRAKSESIHEFIYPTEYEPPEFPTIVPDDGQAQPIAPDWSPATPTAFETRNIGSILEIEPTLSFDSSTIDLRFSPELIYYTGNEIWTEVTRDEDTYQIQMPNFYTIRITTGVTLITGQPLLAAAASPKNDKGNADFSKKILIFVKADVLTVGR